MNSLGYIADHALVYARADIKVFPAWGVIDGPGGLRCSCSKGYDCTSPGKHPRIPPAHRKDDPLYGKCYGKCGKEGHGLYDATTDEDTITRWADHGYWGGIGKPAHGSGVAVIDVDPKYGGDESFARLHAFVEERTGVDLMDTLVQNTGSHNGRRGMHLEYTAPEGGVGSRARTPFGADMPGLDTRGVGGYTIVWPTLHISGVEYEYIDWLREPAPWPTILTDLMNPPKPVTRLPNRQRRTGVAVGYAETALNREVDRMHAATEGTRNDVLNLCAFNLGQLVQSGELTESTVQTELLSAAMSVGLPMAEVLRTIQSGITGGLSKPRQSRRAA